MSAPHPSSLRTEYLHPLLARWQQGDRQAADELIRRVSLRLEALARRMLRRFPVVHGQVQTGDVVQEACLRLLNALRQAQPQNTTHFFNLASRHIRFHLLDLARRPRRGAPQPLDEQGEPVAAGTEPVEAVEELERWAAFHEAVEQLPTEECEVVGQRFYNGRTWPEIAEQLQIPERTARRRWDRACIKLREALGGWGPHAEDEPE